MALRMILDSIEAGAGSLDEIAGASGGMYPSTLQPLLAELSTERLIYRVAGRYRVRTAQQTDRVAPTLCVLPSSLPLPHPCDCDWRFQDSAAKYLAATITKASPRSAPVLLIGAPRLFVELTAMSETSHVYLLDSNRELIETVNNEPLPPHFHAIYHDLTNFGPSPIPEAVGVVFCDPPWYPEYYDSFLAHASLFVELGGKVFVSLLPALTRPGAWQDRWQLLASANALGLHVESLTIGVVRYETPLFEHRSLAREGITVGDCWRAADLLLLRKYAEPNAEAIERIQRAVATSLEHTAWLDILIKGRKLKLRLPLDAPDEPPVLIRIEQDDVLPTVSRRYPGRDLVDLWLWDNRVFGARGRASLWAALNSIAGKPTRDPSVPDPLIRRALDILLPLVGGAT